MIRIKNSALTLAFSCLFLGTALFVSCGGDAGKSDQTIESETPAAESVAADTGKAKSDGKKTIPEDWKQASWDKFKFWIPADWKRESGTDVWFPPTESFAMGLPNTSLHCGAMPIMGDSVDEQVKQMLHGSALSKTPVDKCNLKGHIREARDDYGLRHLTLTLEEGGVMTVVNFFNCRAPAGQYDEYEEIFRKILDSVHCN